MDIRTLRAFVEVVRQGGFSQAAKTVFVTQSAISKAVRQLEDEIGIPLLERIGHSSRMTAAGEVVYARALRILAEREDLLAELDEIRGLKRGALHLGLPPIGSNTLFAPVFAIYRKRFPGIDIRLVEQGSTRLEEMLESGDIELGASLLPTMAGFAFQPVRCEPLVALLPATHEAAHKTRIRFEDLADTALILFEKGFALNRVLITAARRKNIEPDIAARSSQIDFITELVAANLGVSFLPRMIARQRPHPNVRYIELNEPDTQWDMAMIWRQNGFLSHAARAWLEIVREIYPASPTDPS
ncbi:LysR family transcriptional regulator [Thalassospira sp. TSL5-1]|uniref:LysR family transcriptional regulator n=1 Tax=Thalassospira sp. TSL5-1 TaxID=1544451 RepID=UPI000939C8F3|nr:LysR family transcriptional regulator [Thalassospira sp. TSL5-1]OKH87684.1 LysR family transcriptional regulator [Thalassospira sp. TSL5-1]